MLDWQVAANQTSLMRCLMPEKNKLSETPILYDNRKMIHKRFRCILEQRRNITQIHGRS